MDYPFESDDYQYSNECGMNWEKYDWTYEMAYYYQGLGYTEPMRLYHVKLIKEQPFF